MHLKICTRLFVSFLLKLCCKIPKCSECIEYWERITFLVLTKNWIVQMFDKGIFFEAWYFVVNGIEILNRKPGRLYMSKRE